MSRISDRPIGKRDANKQDRRQAIIQAARRSFLEEGYAATSMSGLLKELGGSKATLWGYFRSKEDLFAAVIDEVASVFCKELEGELCGGKDIETTLVTFFEAFIPKITQPDEIAAWRLVVAESGRFPQLGRIFYEKAASQVEHSLAVYFRTQIAAGRLCDEDPTEMARIMVGFCATKQNERLWGIHSDENEDVAADAKRFVGYFMRLFSTT